MLGPLMPGFEARWHVGDEHKGMLFAAQGAASLIVSVFAGQFAQRFGLAAMMMPGLLLIAIAAAGFALATSWVTAMFCATALGAGLGLSIPAGNLGTAEADPENAARAVMVLNLAWCTGALLAPLGIQYTGQRFLPALTVAILIAAAIALSIPNMRSRGCSRVRPASRALSAVALLASLLVFFYVGLENSVSGWISVLALRSGAESSKLWAILPTLFWIGMFTGRATAPFLLKSITAGRLVLWAIGVGLAGTVLLLTGHLMSAALVCGIGLAPIFPAVVAQFAPLATGSSLAGSLFAAANLGAAVIPLGIGYLSAQSGTLRGSLSALVPLCFAVFYLQVRLSRHAAREQPVS